MTTSKSGAFLGVSVMRCDSNFWAEANFKFQNGVFVVSIYDDMSLSDIIKQYDIGVPNMGVKFAFTDYNKMTHFECNIWDCEENILNMMLSSWDDKLQEYVQELLKDVEPNCRIDNIGIMFDGSMNQMFITADNPSFFDKKNPRVEEGDWTPEFFDNNIEERSKIRLEKDVVVFYTNNWSTEFWNGPQSYGMITVIGENLIERTTEDYDFSLSEYLKNNDVIWDENTIIYLAGNENSGISITCNLKDINLFKGIHENEEFFSGIKEDIETLLQIRYETHEKYLERLPNCSIRLTDISTIFEYFQRYKEMTEKWTEEFHKEVQVVKGAKCSH